MTDHPKIPVVDLGWDGFDRLVGEFRDRLDQILGTARRHYTSPVLWLGDRLAQRWAARAGMPYLDEYAAVARATGRSGAWLLNFSYEWGCTAAIAVEPSGAPRLLRTMDWQLPSLGRTLLAIRSQGSAGDWINLGWPGFVGAVQGLAPGRFAASINQPPALDTGFGPFGDWLASKRSIWRTGTIPPVLLLRAVFDTARTFAEARSRLITTPICAPAIYTLVGVRAGESVIIERTPDAAEVHDGAGAVSNHWLSSGLSGRARSRWTVERLGAMRAHLAARSAATPPFAWLTHPILNDTTRLALEAVPATGELLARGYEPEGPATECLVL